MSTRLLIRTLVSDGEAVTLLHAEEPRPLLHRWYQKLTNIEVKVSGGVGQGVVAKLSRRLGARMTRADASGVPTLTAQLVENALIRGLGETDADVVVVSSVSRVAWMRIRSLCAARRVPVFLYLREEALLAHLALTNPPDGLLANSRALCKSAEEIGFTANFVPSVVDVSASSVKSSLDVVLVINPTKDYGMGRCLQLARDNPGCQFVLQESTRLTADERAIADSATQQYPNVELREFTSDIPGIYSDARLLLAPYTPALRSNRPRVILEAQANGIPVLASNMDGLVEIVGPGGLVLAEDAADGDWSAALQSMFTESVHADLRDKALAHAARPELQPTYIGRSFLAALDAVLCADGGSEPK